MSEIFGMENRAIDFMDRCKKVSSFFSDEISKGIFSSRILFSSNINDRENILKEMIVSSTSPNFSNFVKECGVAYPHDLNDRINHKKTIVIYGAGAIGKEVLLKLNKESKVIFVDRKYNSIQEIDGVMVVSPEVLLEDYHDSSIIICASVNQLEINKYLLENGINKKNIHFPNKIMIDPEAKQYFEDFLKKVDNEFFVDAGMFSAQSSLAFIEWINNDYSKICGIEADKNSFSKIKEEIIEKNIKNIEIYPYALWDKKDTIKFMCYSEYAHSSSAYYVNENFAGAYIDIQADSLDNILGDVPVTFIKMDIEGSELNALKGACKLIRKYKPKLAISIYHKDEDIITLPEYIKLCVPEYKLFLRHYSNSNTETVLYATL